MSRRNNDAITIHSILSWIEDNLESPLSLEKVSERSGYSKWHLQRMFKKETGHSLGQYIRSRKLTEIAQKLKQSNEPILYLAERYGFESQQTLTRTFKNFSRSSCSLLSRARRLAHTDLSPFIARARFSATVSASKTVGF